MAAHRDVAVVEQVPRRGRPRAPESDASNDTERHEVTASLASMLAQIDAPGTFATRLRAPARDLDIEVKGVGPIDLPISARLAAKLRSVARPSPFGLRDQTLHDASVRVTWEIAAGRVKIAARR